MTFVKVKIFLLLQIWLKFRICLKNYKRKFQIQLISREMIKIKKQQKEIDEAISKFNFLVLFSTFGMNNGR